MNKLLISYKSSNHLSGSEFSHSGCSTPSLLRFFGSYYRWAVSTSTLKTLLPYLEARRLHMRFSSPFPLEARGGHIRGRLQGGVLEKILVPFPKMNRDTGNQQGLSSLTIALVWSTDVMPAGCDALATRR